MAERSRKKGIALNLSFFSAFSEHKPPILIPDSKDSAKSPRTFEREAVGLGIVAAMNDSVNGFDDATISSSKATRAAILSVSPRSQPIPISYFPSSTKSPAKFVTQADPNWIGDSFLEKAEMELSEGYTCVISNLGNNLIKKREYYNDEIVVNCVTSDLVFKSSIFSASHGKAYSSILPSRTADFLKFCDLCKKTLHGVDIFIYRGEKAFCSAECRYKQMSIESSSSALFDHSSSCSTSPMKFTEVAAA